jgi:hypothetical protein
MRSGSSSLSSAYADPASESIETQAGGAVVLPGDRPRRSVSAMYYALPVTPLHYYALYSRVGARQGQ